MNMRTTECRHCGRLIGWARTPAGKAMPIDPAPTSAGNVFCQYEGGHLIGRVRVKGDPQPEGVGFMPHWATCPVLNKRSADDKVKKSTKPQQPEPEQLGLL